jgi:hypothetical protein
LDHKELKDIKVPLDLEVIKVILGKELKAPLDPQEDRREILVLLGLKALPGLKVLPVQVNGFQ